MHIVCLDVPYPPDYGGACEMYHKVKALSGAGVSITLHCFDYGRGRQPELDRWCRQVHYYPRNDGHKGLSLTLPYIVASRANPRLTENLCIDEAPILFEGIHTTYPLAAGHLKNRECYVRLHNLEHEYYGMLAKQVPFGIRRLLYSNESRLLKAYEKSISDKAVFLTLTDLETKKLKASFPGTKAIHLPAFIGREQVESLEGEGTFCLYHGNLSVPENDRAVRWLLKDVFASVELPFVIAGKRPSASLRRMAHRKSHTCIVEDPSSREIEDLVRRAQLHVLPSFSGTGVKFKLLNAVFTGRHVVANAMMLSGTGLEKACHLAEGADSFRKTISELFRRGFTKNNVEARNELLGSLYCDRQHAMDLISLVWSHDQ